MPTFSLSWTPNPNSTSQIVEYRPKGSPTYLTTGVAPANPQTPTAAAATISGLSANTVYEFRISNECEIGGDDYTSEVKEDIVFGCIGTLTRRAVSVGSLGVRLTGANVGSLQEVEFVLYNSGNTLVQQSGYYTLAATIDHTFSAIPPGTYTVGRRYRATVNGNTVTSSFDTTTCRQEFIV